MSNELQRVEPEHADIIPHQPLPPPSLFGTADPVEVVAKAIRVAAALKEVIKAQGLISKISGKEYPRCEAWTLLGTMLGVFPVLVWTRPIEGGWEARVEARTRDGSIVGAAEAQCLKSERNWSNRDDFALRSMAQTRATAKALRMPLGFVMTLGGFQATPAEEMDFEQKPEKPAPANVPQRTSVTPATSNQKRALATEDQKARWLALLAPLGHAATIYGWEHGWMLAPADDFFPGEPVELMGLEYVPTTKSAANTILAEIRERMDGPPSEICPPAEANLDGTNICEGKLEQVSEKSGRSKRGPWTNYGLRIGDLWFNSFDRTLGELAKKLKGADVRITFKAGEKGNELVGLERVDH